MENLSDITPHNVKGATKVFVNGVWLGIHRNPENLVTTLRKLRRSLDVSHEVSIVWDIREMELRMYTDSGRICRPLFIVENGRLVLTKDQVRKLSNREITSYGWNQLLADGIAEYLDTDEEETVLICMNCEDLYQRDESDLR